MQGERIATTILALFLLTASGTAQTLPSGEQAPATQTDSSPLAVETGPAERAVEPMTQPDIHGARACVGSDDFCYPRRGRGACLCADNRCARPCA